MTMGIGHTARAISERQRTGEAVIKREMTAAEQCLLTARMVVMGVGPDPCAFLALDPGPCLAPVGIRHMVPGCAATVFFLLRAFSKNRTGWYRQPG